MNSMIATLTALQIGLPLALILLNLAPTASRTGFLLRSAAIALLIVYAALTGIWMFPPFWTGWALLALHLLLVAILWRRKTPRPARPWLRTTELALGVAATIAVAAFLVPAWIGRSVPGDLPDLANPLGPGRYLVVSGGASPALNPHLETLTLERARPYRGQSHAVDIIAIDRWGRDSVGISPADPTAYAIYGTEVRAPCDGTVAFLADGVADTPVPIPDRANMIGNAVMLDCPQGFVLLAHFAPDSLAVALGDTVTTGQPLGRVGNTGNTNAPHLHIHLQSDMPADMPVGGTPEWFTVDGRFLVRNDIFTVN